MWKKKVKEKEKELRGWTCSGTERGSETSASPPEQGSAGLAHTRPLGMESSFSFLKQVVLQIGEEETKAESGDSSSK